MARSLAFVLATGSACGPVVDDDTGGDTSHASSSAEATDGIATAGTTGTPVTATNAIEGSSTSTGGPVDCYLLSDDVCTNFAECQTSRGTEALPTGVPGEYSCSDLAEPFGCAPIDCELFTGIVCKLDEPGVARWLFEPECIPGGWEPCPDATCV